MHCTNGDYVADQSGTGGRRHASGVQQLGQILNGGGVIGDSGGAIGSVVGAPVAEMRPQLSHLSGVEGGSAIPDPLCQVHAALRDADAGAGG